MDFSLTIEARGQNFDIERDGCISMTLKGLKNTENGTRKTYVGFPPLSDIRVSDWLINTFGERFFVTDAQTQFVNGEPCQKKCFIQSQVEYNKSLSAEKVTQYNIGNAYGSVIGDGAAMTVTIEEVSFPLLRQRAESEQGPDKNQISELIDLLEKVVESKEPVKKGMFSKFSAVMERHSWLSSAVASALIGWLSIGLC